MPKFTSKPITIEAEQFLPDSAPLPFQSQMACTLDEQGWYVTTIHGQRTPIVSGDWIIPEPDGVHFYPCKPDVFEKRYGPPSPSVPEVVSDSRAEAIVRWCVGAQPGVQAVVNHLLRDRAARVAEAAAKDEKINELAGELLLIRDALTDAFEDIESDDPKKRLASHLAISCAADPVWKRLPNGHWTYRYPPTASCPPANAGAGR